MHGTGLGVCGACVGGTWLGLAATGAHHGLGARPLTPANGLSLGNPQNLMKLGHNKRGELDMPEEEKPPIRKFKSWVIGLIIFITGNVLNFVSFGEGCSRRIRGG